MTGDAEPTWVRESVVLAIHQRQMAEHGGHSGLRDRGLLRSALSRPQHHWAYAESRPTLCELAARYAYALSGNHPFVDGNKRVALVVCFLFLRLNGLQVEVVPADKYRTFMALAEGTIDEAALARWLQEHAAPR